MKILNNSLKALLTSITLTPFVFCKTHQSLARNQLLFPKSRSERVNTKVSLQKKQKQNKKYIYIYIYICLVSNKPAHSIKICLTVITALHATQTGGSSFLKIKECVK